ncbi:SAF domain-containing protein [Actinacidiphila glaucinigra]|uniref:SAF domain-containing protein n=1 Tax=Actinacidiphila glaucinigra TaxID=235986 RepID=A0A239LTW8_9ACTN|nr:SAF domain-containing protein [Actinacidiphila glaucinigra]SNT33720.1 SAF domain-containing protein [Actinacidiphila glaucinigra]
MSSTARSVSPASAAAPTASAGPQAGPVAAPRMVRQRRRRPGLIALSVALIAAGGLSGAVLYSRSGHRTPVIVVARDVPVGSRITEADLATASIALDSAVRSVKASRAGGLVGQRAATDLKAGSLLAPSQVTDQSLLGPGEQLVGVSVKPSQLPATPLVPGEKVLIVSTPDSNGAPSRTATNGDGSTAENGVGPVALSAKVVAVGRPAAAAGALVVDVAVPAAEGPALAAQVATGNVALVVVARDGS